MAKHFLNINNEDFDFALIGLTFLKDQYEAVVSINEALNINLYLSDTIPFYLKENKSFNFSLYKFTDEDLGLQYYFIPNTSNFEPPSSNGSATDSLFSGLDVDESIKLVKELPKTDYFLILKGEELTMFQFKIIEELKKMAELVQVQSIDISELPSKRNLVF